MQFFRGDLAQFRAKFETAEPFQHIVLDDLWDDEELERITAEFPPKEHNLWQTYPDPKEFGKHAGGPEMWGSNTEAWFKRMFTEQQIIEDLQEITGIRPLFPDIIGGGMHMTTEGGRLASHVDFNIHPSDPTFERRINFLVFLNHDWKKKYGGTLYLGENREVAVNPKFNRTVIFATSKKSYHGHPEPVVAGHVRKSLACYYYAPRREETKESNSTIWQEAC